MKEQYIIITQTAQCPICKEAMDIEKIRNRAVNEFNFYPYNPKDDPELIERYQMCDKCAMAVKKFIHLLFPVSICH